mmetsp:Transcript_148905/g.414895  ORF Transcript_148905/g.414895 Transcript_148905/m.414895 type:complete len:208 (-) Transcript_148905:490-1113(-)
MAVARFARGDSPALLPDVVVAEKISDIHRCGDVVCDSAELSWHARAWPCVPTSVHLDKEDVGATIAIRVLKDYHVVDILPLLRLATVVVDPLVNGIWHGFRPEGRTMAPEGVDRVFRPMERNDGNRPCRVVGHRKADPADRRDGANEARHLGGQARAEARSARETHATDTRPVNVQLVGHVTEHCNGVLHIVWPVRERLSVCLYIEA